MNKWKYTKTVLLFSIYVIIYFVGLAIIVPKLLSAASTISFFAGIAISLALGAFAIYKLVKWLVKLL